MLAAAAAAAAFAAAAAAFAAAATAVAGGDSDGGVLMFLGACLPGGVYHGNAPLDLTPSLGPS